MGGDTEFEKAKAIKENPSLYAIYSQTRLFRAVVWELRGFNELLKTKECYYDPSATETHILKSYLTALGAIDPNNSYLTLDSFIELFVDNAGTVDFDDLSYFYSSSYFSEFLSENTFAKLKIFYKKHLYKNYKPPFTVFHDEDGRRVADLRGVDARDRIYEGREYRVILRDAAENLYGKDWCLEKGINPRYGSEIGGVVFRAIKLEDRGVWFVNSDGWSEYNKLDSEIFARWHSLIKIIET